jgi:molecular chaperone HscB
MNYFELMGIPVSFQLDEDQLRKKFYENSKKYHPDFHTMSDEDKKEEVLELSTLNNLAFKTLSNFDNRFKYILQLTNTIEEGEKYELSPDFLMEMMDINEELMELQFDFDASKFEELNTIFKNLENNINDSIINRIHSIPFPQEGEEKLNDLKDLYYRKKYLLRIKENLDKFAHLQ